MNLMERAETRRETFYKLTNSVAIPEAPSVGGRNLLTGTRDWNSNIKRWANNNGVWNDEPDEYNNLKVKSTTGGWNGWHQNVFVKAGEYYTLSYYAKSDTNISVKNSLMWEGSPVFEGPVATFDGNNDIRNNITTEWKRHSRTVKITGNGSLQWRIEYDGVTLPSGKWYIAGMKLEERSSASNYGVAPEDLGWTMNILVPTQSNRYLWKFEYIYYSDGSIEVTQPTNISIAGVNGQTSHVHFAFADNATGGGFSLTTPKAYMGWYADFNEAASTDPTKYRWSKWKGDQGLPGKPGADGKTSYFHMAYADSADGRTGFSFKESGQQYQGYYTDFTQTNSTDPARYTWMDRRAGVEVGGRNYIRDFGFVKNHNFYNTVSEWKFERVSDSTAWSGCTIKATCTKAGGGGFHKVLIDLRDAKWQGRTMTYSVYVKASKSIRMRLGSEAFNGDCQIFDATTSWQRFVSTDAVNYKKYYSFPFYSDSATWVIGDVVFLRDPQLEDGNIATTPIPALEDVQSDIDSKADQTLTQEQLNALVEKNSIIKAEMEAKASIDTVNQWITAYQNYVNANDEARAESEKNLQEAAARILQLKTDVGALRQQWDFIDTYMSIQNEGLIIGKSDGSAFAKFANDRISLFSGSSEVMYISQGTLHIENGIFTKTIQIGRFRFETHPADKDMLVLRYLGG